MGTSDATASAGKAVTGGLIPFVDRSGIQIEEARRGYVRLRLPFEGNGNHVGTVYAGALFTLAELPGGTLFVSTFDAKKYYPIVKEMQIRFLEPATTDVTVEVSLSEAQARAIAEQADAKGKANYEWECELKDASGVVVAKTRNAYQMRRHGA